MKKSSWNPSLCVLTLKRSRNKTRRERKLWWPAGWRGPHAVHNSLSYGHHSDRAGHLSVSLILWGFHCSCSPDFRLPPALLLNLRMRMAAAHSRRGHDRPWWANSDPSPLPFNPHICLKPPVHPASTQVLFHTLPTTARSVTFVFPDSDPVLLFLCPSPCLDPGSRPCA